MVIVPNYLGSMGKILKYAESRLDWGRLFWFIFIFSWLFADFRTINYMIDLKKLESFWANKRNFLSDVYNKNIDKPIEFPFFLFAVD
jgi:hypothetical protein